MTISLYSWGTQNILFLWSSSPWGHMSWQAHCNPVTTHTWTNHFCFPVELYPACLVSTQQQVFLAAQPCSLWHHQSSHCLFFEPVLSSVWHGVTMLQTSSTAMRLAGPSCWPRLVTSTSFIHSPTQEFTHPQLFGEIMQHIHWHSNSIGNNLKIHALFPHKEKGKASEKYTIIILKQLVQ